MFLLRIKLRKTWEKYMIILYWIFTANNLPISKLDLILTALETLEIFPEACPLVSSRGYGELTDDGKRYRYMPIENYLAFYYIDKYEVYVSRILNSKQNWAKLFNK